MKRFILGILSVACVFSFAACKNQTTSDNLDDNVIDINENNNSSTETKDLENVYDYIIEAQPENLKNDLTFFQETDQEMIESYYPGLSDISLKQENIYTPAIIGFAQEIALVEVENSNDVDKVKEIFNKRIEDCKNSVACDPEINELWATNAEVQVSGNFVAMIALPEGYIIPNNVFANL